MILQSLSGFRNLFYDAVKFSKYTFLMRYYYCYCVLMTP